MTLKERILGLLRVELRTAFEERDRLQAECERLRAELKTEEALIMYFWRREDATMEAMHRLYNACLSAGSSNEKMIALADFAQEIMKHYYKEAGFEPPKPASL